VDLVDVYRRNRLFDRASQALKSAFNALSSFVLESFHVNPFVPLATKYLNEGRYADAQLISLSLLPIVSKDGLQAVSPLIDLLVRASISKADFLSAERVLNAAIQAPAASGGNLTNWKTQLSEIYMSRGMKEESEKLFDECKQVVVLLGGKAEYLIAQRIQFLSRLGMHDAAAKLKEQLEAVPPIKSKNKAEQVFPTIRFGLFATEKISLTGFVTINSVFTKSTTARPYPQEVPMSMPLGRNMVSGIFDPLASDLENVQTPGELILGGHARRFTRARASQNNPFDAMLRAAVYGGLFDADSLAAMKEKESTSSEYFVAEPLTAPPKAIPISEVSDRDHPGMIRSDAHDGDIDVVATCFAGLGGPTQHKGRVRVFLIDEGRSEEKAATLRQRTSTNNPVDLQIWYGGSRNIMLEDGAAAAAVIYAPYARVLLGPGHCNFIGAIVAREIIADGHVMITFDKSLLDAKFQS
jgi:hypothetical protein